MPRDSSSAICVYGRGGFSSRISTRCDGANFNAGSSGTTRVETVAQQTMTGAASAATMGVNRDVLVISIAWTAEGAAAVPARGFACGVRG